MYLPRSVPKTVFETSRGCSSSARAILISLCDHRVAILVRQGSDPTPAYQALVIVDPVLVRVGVAEVKTPLPVEASTGTLEAREKYSVKPALTRMSLTGLTLKTVKGTSVSVEQLAKLAADKPIGVAILPDGKTEIDPFWKPILKPTGIVVSGVTTNAEQKK